MIHWAREHVQIGTGKMDKLRFVNQWAQRPKSSDPEKLELSEIALGKVVVVERKKAQALRRAGRDRDRAGCDQMRLF